MTEYEREPQSIGEILRIHQAVDKDGAVNRLGVLALLSGRDASEVDPLEVETNEFLSEMVMNPSTDLETLQRINNIAKTRHKYIKATTPQTIEGADLQSMTNQELSDLLKQGHLSDSAVLEIDRIARERSQGGGLSSSGD